MTDMQWSTYRKTWPLFGNQGICEATNSLESHNGNLDPWKRIRDKVGVSAEGHLNASVRKPTSLICDLTVSGTVEHLGTQGFPVVRLGPLASAVPHCTRNQMTRLSRHFKAKRGDLWVL